MANRNMAAKANKARRQKRAWAKQFSFRGMQSPNRLVLDQYKMSARGLAHTDESIADKVALGFKGITPGRLEAIKRQAELEASMPEGLDQSFKGPGPDNSYQRSRVYYNVTRTCFIVVHEDFKAGLIRRSITYSSKEVLVMKWNMDKVTWVAKEPIIR